MPGFIDPRTGARPSANAAPALVTNDPDEIRELLNACAEGRLYDVERWIASDRPLQLHPDVAPTVRRRRTPLRIALKRRDHALTLLLLCNGYDLSLEPGNVLNDALEAKRPDLVELLLERGADPHRVCRYTLFGTYESALFHRWYALGVDLTSRQALARALGERASNKPLYGFAKRHHATDPKIQHALDTALAMHAGAGRERGVLLCLWAGADPHASASYVPPYEYDEEDEDEWEESGGHYNAVHAAASGGHAALLERLGPDPARDDFDAMYSWIGNAAAVDVLARFTLPTDVTTVVHQLIQGAMWGYTAADKAGALQRLFEHGMQWMQAPKAELAQIRRSLLQINRSAFATIVRTLARPGGCAPDILHELGRTPAFQRRLQEERLVPNTADRAWRSRHGAAEAEALARAFRFPLARKSTGPHRSRRTSG